MKNRKMAALLILLVCLIPWAAFAEPAGSDGYHGTEPYIQDDADLLTEEEEAALYLDMLPICEFGAPMFWTTREAGDYETLARNFYHSRLGNGVSGTLFVINMRARQLTVFSDGAIYKTVTRAEANTITDNVFRMAGREEYYECASSAFFQIYTLLQGGQIARPMKVISNVLLALVAALLIMYLYIRGRYETRPKTGASGAALPVSAAAGALFSAALLNQSTRMTQQKKTDISSSSGGGGGHGGFGGGGGGGGSSGGGGSHGF